MSILDIARLVGDNLRRARHRQSLSQRAVAERVGISQSQISRFENGLSGVGLDMLVRLARSLNIGIPALFEGAF